MLLYNKKIGFLKNYYDAFFTSFFSTSYYVNNKLYSSEKNICFMIYPILYKKLSFFRFSCVVLKKKKMKSMYNLNQTVIIEGFISRNKCLFSIPIYSLTNNVL